MLSRLPHGFHYPTHIISLLERFFVHARVPRVMLKVQYRMYPNLPNFRSAVFYDGNVNNGVPEGMFLTNFNDILREGPFRPSNFIDTLASDNRHELNTENGEYVNDLEAREVEPVIEELISVEDVHRLEKCIAVLVPYNSQMDYIRRILECGVFRDVTGRKQMDVTISTIHSMQGGQRKIIIFSATRSNVEKNCGFPRTS